MKSNYIIRLITWEGEETQIPFRGSPRQADRVFIALAYALCESLYKYVFLDLQVQDSKKNLVRTEIVNSVQFRGVEHGV